MDANGDLTFTLTHWQKIELTLPSDAEITVTEQTDYYTATFTAVKTDSPTGPVTFTTLPAGATGDQVCGVSLKVTENTTLTATNTLGAVSPTGVAVRYLPFALMLGAGLVLALAAGKRRRHADQAE